MDLPSGFVKMKHLILFEWKWCVMDLLL